MEIIERYQVRGLPGTVCRTSFDGRRVDFWAPQGGASHLLVAHDGQNIFDRRTATRMRTWKLAQTATRVFPTHGFNPPAIIAVYHSSSKSDPHGRIKDLTPQDPYQAGVEGPKLFPLHELRGNSYHTLIAEEIIPTIADSLALHVDPKLTAMIGSSMGGLSTLYALSLYPDLYKTALAFSPHWTIGGNPLVDALLTKLPKPGSHKIWMSRGTKGLDAAYEPFQDYADTQMEERGWQLGSNFASHIYPRSGHNEPSWARYVDQALKFWLEDSA